jgi:hypothetical protein
MQLIYIKQDNCILKLVLRVPKSVEIKIRNKVESGA